MDSPKQILIVEDEKFQRTSLSLILTRKGYRVTYTGSGQEACSFLQCQPFDLALLDLQLEDMNGLDLLTKVQECDPDMKTIIMTGNVTDAVEREASRRGATGIIFKPVNPQELLEKISQILS